MYRQPDQMCVCVCMHQGCLDDLEFFFQIHVRKCARSLELFKRLLFEDLSIFDDKILCDF